jgi:hypothetical protein
MEFGENPFWALGWIVTGVRATIPQLLANYFPAACQCFTSVPESPNWDHFSRPPSPTPMLQGVHANPPSLYLCAIWSAPRASGGG